MTTSDTSFEAQHKFIIFYDDGSQIEGNELFFAHIKSFGVICIVQDRGQGRKHILSQKDYYFFNGKYWICVDEMGLVDHLVHKPESIQKFIVGRTIDNESYREIFERAKEHV